MGFPTSWKRKKTANDPKKPAEDSIAAGFVPRRTITLALLISLLALGLTLNASKFDGNSSDVLAASVKNHSLTTTSSVPSSTRTMDMAAANTQKSARATLHPIANTHKQPIPMTTTTAPSTTTTTTVKATGSPIAGPVFGISLPTLITQTPATQAAWLENIKNLGITSVRIGADWAWIQYGGPTAYDWSQLDQEVASIRAAGLSIDIVILGTPPWAAVPSVAGDPMPQPADPATFGAFAATVAARYAPDGVRDFEIWNEPNNAVFWQPAPNPAAYAADLIASYAAIKAVDPEGLVITGGLAPETNDGTDINPITFLQDMYADGAKGAFDAVGDHPYSFPALPNTYEDWSGWSQMSQTPTSIESVLAANDDATKPLWLTEVGAPTGGPDGVGDAAQAEELTQAIADAKASSFIAALYIYTYEDSGTDPTTDEDWFGLLSATGTPKPSFAAVAAAIS